MKFIYTRKNNDGTITVGCGWALIVLIILVIIALGFLID